MYIHVCIYVHVYISLEKEEKKRFDEMGKKKKNRVYIYTNKYIHTYMHIK